MAAFRAEVESRFRELRDRIVAKLEELEGGAKFSRTAWERPGGGGGEMAAVPALSGWPLRPSVITIVQPRLHIN